MLGYRRVRRHPAVRGRLVVSLARLRDPLLVDARERSGSSRRVDAALGTGHFPPLLSSLLSIVPSAPRRVAGAAPPDPRRRPDRRPQRTRQPPVQPIEPVARSGQAGRASTPAVHPKPWIGGSAEAPGAAGVPAPPTPGRATRRRQRTGRATPSPGRARGSAAASNWAPWLIGTPSSVRVTGTRYRCCCATCASSRSNTCAPCWLDGRNTPRAKWTSCPRAYASTPSASALPSSWMRTSPNGVQCRRGRPRDRRREPSSTRVPGRRAGRRRIPRRRFNTGRSSVQPRQPGSGAHRRGPSAPTSHPTSGPGAGQTDGQSATTNGRPEGRPDERLPSSQGALGRALQRERYLHAVRGSAPPQGKTRHMPRGCDASGAAGDRPRWLVPGVSYTPSGAGRRRRGT